MNCRGEGIHAFFTTTYRSNEEQEELYAQGRTKAGKIVTNARAGQSKHNFTIDGKPAARAFDVAVKNDDGSLNWNTKHPHWKRIGEIGKALGLVWGAEFKSIKDFPHFQMAEL